MTTAEDRRGVRAGVVSGLVLGAVASAGFAYSNLGPSSKSPTSDSTAVVLVGYAGVAVVFIVQGLVCRARGMSVRQCAIVGAVTGMVMLTMVAAAIVIINNVWLSTVADQPDKIDGMAHSRHFHTMRAYLNGQVAFGLVVLPPFVATGCALLAAVGARVWRRMPPTSGSGVRGLA